MRIIDRKKKKINIRVNQVRKDKALKIFFIPFYLPILTSFLLLITIGCSSKERPYINNNKPADDPPEFNVYIVKSLNINRDIVGLGNLEVLNKATVRTRIDGIIERVYVKKGDKVKKDDNLFYISNYGLEIEYAKAEKALMEAEEELETVTIQYDNEKKNLYKKFIQLEKRKMEIRNMERELSFMSDSVYKKKLLFNKGGITEEAYNNLVFSLESKKRKLDIMNKEYELAIYGFRNEDIIAAGYDVPDSKKGRESLLIYLNTKLQRKRIKFAEIAVKKASLDKDRVSWLMKKRTVHSPSDGVVTDISKFVGEKVSTDDALTTVIDLSSLIARVSFSERDLPFFKIGNVVNIYIEPNRRKVKGTIYTIDPYVDRETRSVSINCLIKNVMEGKNILLPGMFVKVIVPVKRVEKRLIIPKEALITGTNNEGYVFIVSNDGRVYRRQILCTDYDDDNVIVLNGVKESDTILLEPSNDLRDGMKVKIRL